MCTQVLKCKVLNNADKKCETIEIYTKALLNMAEILLVELDTNISAKQLFELLDDNCGGLHHPSKLVNLPTNIGYYAEASSIPEYINA